jgi:hypothetical protein
MTVLILVAAALAATLEGATTQGAAVADAAVRADGSVMLELPRTLAAGETPVVDVRVGSLARGQEIEISTPAGAPLGVISPHGPRAGADGGTYAVPIPASAFQGRGLVLRLRTTPFGRPPRGATPQEVLGVSLNVVKASP